MKAIEKQIRKIKREFEQKMPRLAHEPVVEYREVIKAEVEYEIKQIIDQIFIIRDKNEEELI